MQGRQVAILLAVLWSVYERRSTEVSYGGGLQKKVDPRSDSAVQGPPLIDGLIDACQAQAQWCPAP